MRKMRRYRDYLSEKLADRERAMGHIQAALEEYHKDGDALILRMALESVVDAQGGLDALSVQTGIDRSNLLKALSSDDNLHLDMLGKILSGLGFQLSVTEKPEEYPR